MRISFVPLALILLLFTTTGCVRTRYVPVSTGTSAASSVLLVNQTQTPVYYVYLSPCSSNSWGQDQLGGSEVVMPGTQRSFSMAPGCWDLKAKMRDEREVSQRNIRLSAGSSWTWTLTGN